MSRKKCNRKIWNTSPGFDPVAHAIAGACITNKKTLDALNLRVLSCLEAMTRGKGTVNDWRELVDVVNVAETAGNCGVGPEALPFCELAQASLIAAAKRFESTGRMELSGDGIQAIRDVIEFNALQVSSISRSQYEQILEKTAIRIRSGAGEVVELS